LVDDEDDDDNDDGGGGGGGCLGWDGMWEIEREKEM
jgi:hypothetical protein